MRRLLLLLLFAPLQLLAQEEAIVRVQITPDTVTVGESATLQISVYGPTWFSKPPVFPSFEIPNAIVQLPPDSSRPASTRINGQSWGGIVRNYQVFPLMAATYSIGGQTVRVSIANPGSDPIVADAMIPETRLKATVPAGAEGLDPYISGRKLTLRRELDGDPGTLESGDAIVVTTIAEIEGLPAIFLPPMTSEARIEGVSVYPEEPLIEDGSTARRSEKLTLIFTSGGDFTLPGVALEWWDKDTGAIVSTTLPELGFSVTGELAGPGTPSKSERNRDWTSILLRIAGLVVLLYAVWRLASLISVRARQHRAAIRESEPYAFKQLQKACVRGDTRPAYLALTAWLNRLEPGIDGHRFAREFGDADLAAELGVLSASLYGNGDRQVDLRAVSGGLLRARENFLQKSTGGKGAAVPPLNP